MLSKSTKRATIKDVAHAAGVSVTTVSNVLNGRTGAMSPDTLTRIQGIITALSFRPSSLARSLVTGRPTTIALVIAEIGTPLFLQAVSTMEPLVRQAGYDLILSYARGSEEERQVLGMLREKNVDGVVFISTSCRKEDDHIAQLQSAGVPVVLINRPVDRTSLDLVRWDNSGGIIAAVDHLASLGHQFIAHLSGPENRLSTEERLHGYKTGLAKNGLTYRQEWVVACDFDAPAETWRQAMRQLMATQPRPTAVIGADDSVAAAAMSEAQRSGLRVPQDIAFVGVDDQPFCEYLTPALTTVRLPIAEAGEAAIGLLMQRIADPAREPEQVILSCPLVVRESCGARQPEPRPVEIDRVSPVHEPIAAEDRPAVAPRQAAKDRPGTKAHHAAADRPKKEDSPGSEDRPKQVSLW